MSAVTGFPIHRGVLAIGLRGEAPSPAAIVPAAPAPALVLALAGLTNHDNVGACFRNAAAFGADAVLLDATTCDPLYRKAIRVSAGAALVTPFARLEPETDWLALADSLSLEAVALSPGAARNWARHCPRGRCSSWGPRVPAWRRNCWRGRAPCGSPWRAISIR